MELEQRQNYQENYNRRNNIRITGLQEQPSKTWEETAITVSKLLEDKLQLPSMKIERAHRTGPAVPSRSRTVVARFEELGDREAVQLSSVAVMGGAAAHADDVAVVAARFTRSSHAGSVGMEPSDPFTILTLSVT
ncbi:hypothetical protein Pmani_004561 [Petrolisthes manimaculis]|uniref:Uncharacterized protein n=1 Tax=Petrolisthes manimaculis TaxID=1843537 RepID=A0AAE1QEN7_9EUCA|nr:hypothetical protein Pmani_004561 [Petrolisthes manimaculis]